MDPLKYINKMIDMYEGPRITAQEPRIGLEPGGPVRKNELTKVLTDVGITPSQSNFSKVMTDLDIKKDTKHPLHRKTQPIYIEPTKKELIIKKKTWDKNQLLSFHTGPGREAYELREKRIIELLKKGDLTQSEIDKAIRTEFGTSSKTTIIKLQKKLKIKLPSARDRGPKNPKTAKIIKDLNILKNSEELNNLILKPDFNLMRDIPELEKIAAKVLPKTDADPARRVGQLLLAYSGEDPELQKYVGEVSDDLVKASNVVKTKVSKSSRLLSTLQKIAAEKRASIEIGKTPGFLGSQRKRLGEIMNSFRKGLGIEVDEIRAVGGAKAKTSVYDLFVQGVKDTVNQKKGETLDRLTQTAELDLQKVEPKLPGETDVEWKARRKAKKIKIAEIYNEKVKKFVAEANKNLKPGQLPVRAFEISFDKPSETIKNKEAYTQYKDMFDKIHTEHGYSFKVPKDVMTSEQAKIFLKTDKGQAQLLKQVNLGSSRLYSFPANITADMLDFRKLPGDAKHFANIIRESLKKKNINLKGGEAESIAKKLLNDFGKMGVKGLKLLNWLQFEYDVAFESLIYQYHRQYEGDEPDVAREALWLPKILAKYFPDLKKVPFVGDLFEKYETPIMGGPEMVYEKRLHEIKGTEKENLGKVIGDKKLVKNYIDNNKRMEEISSKYRSLEDRKAGVQRMPGLSYYAEPFAHPRLDTIVNEQRRLENEYNQLEKLNKPDSLSGYHSAYQTALEAQDTERGVKRTEAHKKRLGVVDIPWDVLNPNEMPRDYELKRYTDAQKRFESEQADKRRRETEDMFPTLTKSEVDKKLEEVGLYIDPDLRSYKGRTVQRPEGLKYIGKPVLHQEKPQVSYEDWLNAGNEGTFSDYLNSFKSRGMSYDDVRNYWKDLDKQAYFADNFRMEKAGGGLTRTVAPDSGPMQGLASTPEYDTYRKEYKWQT
jgi:arginine repressor